jgi:hypothetical protein
MRIVSDKIKIYFCVQQRFSENRNIYEKCGKVWYSQRDHTDNNTVKRML